MNFRKRRRRKAESGVLLSPLIDCVFLLLIFFLVTSMIKRFERQIPVTLADDTSSITAEPFDDSYPIGLDRSGNLYSPKGKNWSGVLSFSPLSDSQSWISSLLTERGPSKPVTLVVEKGTPFQKVIDIQDRLEITGFETIRFRIRDFSLDSESPRDR